MFADKIWQQHKIECAFTFKRSKVFVRGEARFYAKFKASCNECGAVLASYMYRKPQKKTDVIFECTLFGICPEVVHKKKRQLKGHLRGRIAGELLDG